LEHLKKIVTSTPIYLFLIFYLFIPCLFSFDKIYLEQEYFRLFKQGEKSRVEGEFEKSIEFFENSLNLARKIPDEKKQCESFIRLGLLNWNIGQLDQSSEKYNKALVLAQKINLSDREQECRNCLEIYRLYEDGKNFRDSGEYLKSIEKFQQAIDLSRKVGSREHEVKCLRQLSLNYGELNKLQELFSRSKDALNIAQSLNHRIEIGRCMILIGFYNFKMNNYSKALIYYNNALEIAKKEKIKMKYEEGICLTNMGIIYLEMGIHDQALEYLEKALSIDKQFGSNEDIAKDLNSIGVAFRRKGLISLNKEDFNKAIDYFKQCLKLAKEIGDIKTEIKVLNNIGSIFAEEANIFTEKEKYIEAMKYFESALKKAEEKQDLREIGIVLTNIGFVYYNQGNYEESSKSLDRVIKLDYESMGGDFLWEALLYKGDSHVRQNKFDEAIKDYEDSINIIENIRSTINLEELKAKFLGTDKRIEPYQNLINLFVTLHDSETQKYYAQEAFKFLEKAKARAFLDNLELSSIDITQGVDPELLIREKEVMKNYLNLRRKFLAAEFAPEEKNTILEQLKEKEDEMKALKLEMRTQSPAYAAINPEIITIKEIQETLLDNNIAFFEYIIGKDQSYAFVVTKKDLKIFPIPARDEVKKSVSNYLKVISDKDNKNFQAGYELFNTLISPGLEKNIKTIIFIPDDILNFLPFETLITNKEKKDWLIKNYKIAYAPSVSSLKEIIKRKESSGRKPQKDILALGDPYFGSPETESNRISTLRALYSNDSINLFRLKYSGLEVDIISTLFSKSKQKIFLRENASEEQLKNNNLAEYKIVHFATHSIIDDKTPAQSSIVLSLYQDPNEDGLLQTREIYNLKLNSDLVTLSACDTGLGELIHGEGIEGLNRAFFSAGTSAVLMSLWAVNDQASCQLMERFYRHLKSSESIMDALRNVKLEMIDSGVLSHPYYWAGFIVSGKADEIIFPKSTSRWLLIGVSLVLAGGIIFVAVRSFKQRL
jgi:CHAT domain-containing protein/Tfp pilus assembly protein PilF